MKITEEKGKIILEDLHDFNPVHTFMCGQCFRWDEADGGFIGIAHGRAVLVKQPKTAMLKFTTPQKKILMIFGVTISILTPITVRLKIRFRRTTA